MKSAASYFFIKGKNLGCEANREPYKILARGEGSFCRGGGDLFTGWKCRLLNWLFNLAGKERRHEERPLLATCRRMNKWERESKRAKPEYWKQDQESVMG